MKIHELREEISDYEKMKEKSTEYSDSIRYVKIIDDQINNLKDKITIIEKLMKIFPQVKKNDYIYL
jgi:hypothetical protein